MHAYIQYYSPCHLQQSLNLSGNSPEGDVTESLSPDSFPVCVYVPACGYMHMCVSVRVCSVYSHHRQEINWPLISGLPAKEKMTVLLKMLSDGGFGDESELSTVTTFFFLPAFKKNMSCLFSANESFIYETKLLELIWRQLLRTNDRCSCSVKAHLVSVKSLP